VRVRRHVKRLVNVLLAVWLIIYPIQPKTIHADEGVTYPQLALDIRQVVLNSFGYQPRDVGEPLVIEVVPSRFDEANAQKDGEQRERPIQSRPTSRAVLPRGGTINDFNKPTLARESIAFDLLVQAESGGNFYAVNKSSGACGLPQALPCSKMLNVIGSLDNHQGQIEWMKSYIKERYGSPEAAWSHHQRYGWY